MMTSLLLVLWSTPDLVSGRAMLAAAVPSYVWLGTRLLRQHRLPGWGLAPSLIACSPSSTSRST